jgi:hypothetical protein
MMYYSQRVCFANPGVSWSVPGSKKLRDAFYMRIFGMTYAEKKRQEEA